MTTPAQRASLEDAVEGFLDTMREEVEHYVGSAYAVGREGIAEFVGEAIALEIDAARVETIVQGAFDLIVSIADQWMADVQDLVTEGTLEGITPVTIAGNLMKYFEGMPGNYSVIARDQVAKAQMTGRQNTYRELGISKVEVTCAPDACEECEPYDGLVFESDDEASLPQYHIQCACMDIPVIDAPDAPELSDQEDVEQAQQESEDGDHAGREEEQ